MKAKSSAVITVIAAVVLASLLVFAPGVSAGEQSAGSPAELAAGLSVRVMTPDSKRRITVARELRVLVACSKDCRAKAKIRLKTPINKVNVKGAQLMGAGDVWTTGIRLTGFGLRYLNKNYRDSSLRVAIRAKDAATGKFARKTRTFRFTR